MKGPANPHGFAAMDLQATPRVTYIHTYIHKILFKHASPNNKNAGFHGGREDRVTDTSNYSVQKKKHTHAYK